MRIALISYEYPPDTAFGGIGTYTHQLSHALADNGHDVEVFSCSRTTATINQSVHPNLWVHRVIADNRKTFSKAIVSVFRERHAITPFDIIESPEYGAEGLAVRKHFPQVPFAVKLHTPFFLHHRFNSSKVHSSLLQKLKWNIKQRLQWYDYTKENDADYVLTTTAHNICTPSLFLANSLQKEWQLSNITLLPNYYKANQSLLRLPIQQNSQKVIAFIGRLEKRKGILTIINAIPAILEKHPHVIFRFIGTAGKAPDGITPMDQFILQVLNKNKANLQFVGHVAADQLANALADVSVVMIPSLFENFPYVCLESMAAGKALVVSSKSGMPEMFPTSKEKGCIVIHPQKRKQLAKAVIYLLHHPALCVQMGISNRQHVTATFSGDAMLDKVIQFYKDTIAIANKQAYALQQ